MPILAVFAIIWPYSTHFGRIMPHQIPKISNQQIFTEASQKALLYVKKPLFERHPVSYHSNWLQDYHPNETHYLTKQQKNLLLSHGQRYAENDLAGTYARKIYDRLLIDLSYNSSRLEGNTYSRLDTEKLLLEGKSNKDKLTEETVMILNHKEAIQHIVDNIYKITINENEIATLHYLLSDGLVPAKYAGKMRDHGVRISGSVYIALENSKRLQQQLHIICEKANKIENPFEQSFFLLAHLAYLQAFTDVNKRTSRLSANIPLIKNNCVPLSFNDINKEDYADAMISLYELNEVNPLIDLYCYSYLRTCELYDVTVESLGFDEVRIRYRSERRNLIRYIIINELKNNKLKNYILSESKKHIPEKDSAQFIKTVEEDLQELSPQRIAGLGITQDQLQKWRKL